MNYFNEIDPNAAAWIRQLITDGIIPKGHVDERSITEVTPSDLRGYTQAHFFCGLGGWLRALQLAGWPEDRPVWTASLPCQSFSSAGKQRGTADERHLWPVFERLVRECRPPVLFGEQVASKLARTDWLPGVCLDLQNLGYSATAVDICAPCAGEVGEGRIVRGDQETWERIILGAPHIRQRLYWVASRLEHTKDHGQFREDPLPESSRWGTDEPSERGDSCRMADTELHGHAATERSSHVSGVEQHPRGQGQSERPDDMQQSPATGSDESLQPSDRTDGISDGGMADADGDGQLDGINTTHGRGAEAATECGGTGRMAQPRNDGAGSLAGQARHEGRGTVDTGAEGLRQDHGTACTGGADPRGAGESWKRVSFAADCFGGDDDEPGDECSICGLTYAEDCECPRPTHDGYEYEEFDGVLYARWVGDTGSEGSQGHAGNVGDGGEPGRQHSQQARPAWEASWADSDTILCSDGKARRFEPGIFPLAHGLPRGVVPSGDPGSAEYANATGEARVMRLKGYGNAICAPLAAMFISTCMEVIPHE